MLSFLLQQNIINYKVKALFVDIRHILMSVFLIVFFLSIPLYAQKVSSSENLFYNYLAKEFQGRKYNDNISKKIWNYLSNPANGYKNAGLSTEEYTSLIRGFAESLYSKKIMENVFEVLKIDTRESLNEDKKNEDTSKYIRHIEKLAKEFNLSVTNIENRFLIVYSEGGQPPLGIVGKIKNSNNFIKYEEPLLDDNKIVAPQIFSSKTAIELTLFSIGVLNTINLKHRNRIILYIDLSLSSITNVDVLFKSYEIAPVNLVLDSVFPFACAEYGYAMVNIVQNVGEKLKKSPIKRIVADGGEYHSPSNSRIYLDDEKIERDFIKDKVAKFIRRYNKIEVTLHNGEEFYINFSVGNSSKDLHQNALDYLVLFLSENRELLPDNIKLFEYLRRNIVLNPTGKILGINRYHKLLKNTDVILKKIVINGTSISAQLYIRFPFGIESALLVEKIKGSVDLFKTKEVSDMEVYINAYNPVVVDTNSEVVSRIRKAYQGVSGGSDKCVIADGLYTKLFPNSIGFGPYIQEMTNRSYASEKDILKVFNIYLTALVYLAEK